MAVVARKRVIAAGKFRWDIPLLGTIDGINPTFTTPEYFTQEDNFVLRLHRNGQRETIGGDYSVSESGGAGTGYDTITFVAGAIPKTGEVLRADYVAA